MFSNIEVVKQKFAKLEKEYKDEGKSEEEIAKVSVTEQEINDNLAKVKEQLGDKFNEELEKAKLTEDELKYKIEDNLYSTKFQTWFSENYDPTDEEIMEKYKGSDFDGPQINASHILVENEEDAKKVKSRLEAGEKFEPSIITRHVVNMAQGFNRFYHDEHILTDNDDEKTAKIALTIAAKNAIKRGLALLGMQAPERM